MYNMIGKTRLYTKLAAAARAKENGTDMVDFKALATKNKAKRESSKHVEQEKKESTMNTVPSREDILDNLLALACHEDTTEWEKNFSRSVREWLGKSPTNYMSVKQKLVYDRLVKDHLGKTSESAIPTRDNRYTDGVYRPDYENRNSAAARKGSYGFDDMDDDVPF